MIEKQIDVYIMYLMELYARKSWLSCIMFQVGMAMNRTYLYLDKFCESVGRNQKTNNNIYTL